MKVFLMHVGSPGNVDINYTVTRTRTVNELIEKLPEGSQELDFFKSDLELKTAFPDGHFNCWGIPINAEPRFNETEPGDLVLFAPTIGLEDGGIHQLGIIRSKCPTRAYNASRILWPDTPKERLFPFIFLFHSEIGFRGWYDFLEDIDYSPNWNPQGWYRKIGTSRFDKWNGPQGYLEFLRLECGFTPLESKFAYLKEKDADGADIELLIEPAYSPHFEDRRERIMSTIRTRRGQSKFRDELLKRFGHQCMISNCDTLDVIEASHIIPYRSIEDNHPSNGLLLRSDIHTLFDLDLLGIRPNDLTIHLHPKIKSSDYRQYEGNRLIYKSSTTPSQKALEFRWALFQSRLKEH